MRAHSYHDLLSFESDIAQIVGLILLFAESAGSLAELGAFAALESIAPSLLAVLCSAHYDAQSFIRNGPVAYLENMHGDESVHVLDCSEIGLDDEGRIVTLDLAAFSTSMFTVVANRLDARPEWSKFNPNLSGHAILLIVGLCHEYGALTQKEIRGLLASAGVNDIRFDNYIYCATLLGWLKRVRKGNHVFYVASIRKSFVQEEKARDDIEALNWRSVVADALEYLDVEFRRSRRKGRGREGYPIHQIRGRFDFLRSKDRLSQGHDRCGGGGRTQGFLPDSGIE